MQLVVQKESYGVMQTIYVKEKGNTRVIYYVRKSVKTISSLAMTSLSHFFSSACIFVF